MISLVQAQTVIAAALAHAREANARPLGIIVLDNGGHPVAFAREDGATFFRHDVARAKAYGALGMGDDTRVLAERAKGNAVFFQSLTAVVGGQIAFSPGGVLVRNGADAVIGAVGVSGDTGDMDEECAIAGIKAAGFKGGPA
jgi:uncharacterized protein GlcG (DUF336 family)